MGGMITAFILSQSGHVPGSSFQERKTLERLTGMTDTHIRGKGAGFAASFAKIGAVLAAFLFPLLLGNIGTQTFLYLLVGTSLLSELMTWIFAIETKRINLEEVGSE
jgi:Na+/melibiose symporter-like transporter